MHIFCSSEGGCLNIHVLYLLVRLRISSRQHFLAAFSVFPINLEWTLNAVKEQMNHHFPEIESKFLFTSTKVYSGAKKYLVCHAP